MNRREILRRAKELAAINDKNRRDPRYINTLGFLVAKGFLFANRECTRLPNARLAIEDAIWAGKNVEPRILEVLPAAVIRMPKHFDYDPEKHLDLRNAIHRLKMGQDGRFLNIPLDKIRPWLNFRLRDGRTKGLNQKKITKTFRLSPQAVARINDLRKSTKKSAATIIEELLERG